ncbi:hypothetical protein [Neisseria yangbaofengii]|uniref:hypothetical protein n=1 Tax=Neisseria yangbaofengii TaxID=2709396 RepID=UPI0013EE20C7|nr:hypothetical protein [Neisseria yangbaofengii]
MISEMLGDRPSESMCQKFAGRAHVALNENAEAVKNIEAALDALEIPYCAVSNSDFAKMPPRRHLPAAAISRQNAGFISARCRNHGLCAARLRGDLKTALPCVTATLAAGMVPFGCA